MSFYKHYLSTLRDFQAELPDGFNPAIGNKDSRILMFAPAPTEEELTRRMPLTSADALQMHSLFRDVGVNIEQEFFVVSACPFLSDTKTANFEFGRRLLKGFNKFGGKAVICVGPQNFKFIFGSGRKPNDQSLIGQIIYVELTEFKPLFYLPSLTGLYFRDDGSRSTDNYRAKLWSEKQEDLFNRLGTTLRNQLDKI